ncbi:transcriptional regulator, TraR/DksA family [Rhodopirellula maiorica SM1]|uniref:Transcriptional regulator, TraR/DksA family n=1 Tax=Rhodopirellula maiorica SM1 TaxID=1265738 RepID=M5S5J5_9BACT|nr:TraR/DksA C4-type zinc finger protein [Rhodopirellula maiorica]EMI21464.1 transcriptional regulator, TraR/DksA family [Rhodopirellula maiorica SM1]
MSDYTKLRTELETQLQELVARAEGIDNDLRQPGDDDWEERASESEGDEVLASVGDLAINEIEQIKHALHKMDEGTYGRCTRCGKQIPPERLEVVPYATTCTGCV